MEFASRLLEFGISLTQYREALKQEDITLYEYITVISITSAYMYMYMYVYTLCCYIK